MLYDDYLITKAEEDSAFFVDNIKIFSIFAEINTFNAMIFFFLILIILIYIMFSSAIESASKKKATETDAPQKSIAYKPPEITYHIIDQNVGLHQSANDYINQPKIPEPEESKPKRKPFRPTLGERLEFWIDGAGYDTSNESGIPTNCGTSCSH